MKKTVWSAISKICILLGVFTCSLLCFGKNPGQIQSIVLLGDSQTWIGGDSCENPIGWSHYLKDSGIAVRISTYARSGATWGNREETKADSKFYSEVIHPLNVVSNQVVRLENDIMSGKQIMPEVIIIMAGTNDAWFYPSDTLALAEGVRSNWEKLKRISPAAKLIAVTPVQNSKASEEDVSSIAEIIEKESLGYGVSVLRADKETPFSHLQETATPRLTSDGVHTNSEGARLLAEYIISHLSTESYFTSDI